MSSTGAPSPCDSHASLTSASSSATRPAADPPEPREAAGREVDGEDEEQAEDERRLAQRDAQHRRKAGDGARAGEIRETVVEIGVDDTADQGAPARAGAADHDHDQERERERGRRHVRARSADQHQVDDPAERGKERGQHAGHQLVVERPHPEHLDAQLVLADRLPDLPRRRVDRPAPDDEHDDGVDEREPVEVLRVEDADERPKAASCSRRRSRPRRPSSRRDS